MPAIRDGRDLPQNTGNILARDRAEDDLRLLLRKLLPPRLHQHAGGINIVRTVNDDAALQRRRWIRLEVSRRPPPMAWTSP